MAPITLHGLTALSLEIKTIFLAEWVAANSNISGGGRGGLNTSPIILITVLVLLVLSPCLCFLCMVCYGFTCGMWDKFLDYIESKRSTTSNPA